MPSIKKTIGSGILYTALSKYSNIVISIIITAVLARILSPAEYGIVAIVMVFITFFGYLADFGIGPALIQNKELETDDIESIFSVSILIALVLSATFFSAGKLISNFYDNPELLNIARWLAFSVLLFTLNVVPGALNKKELKFKQLAIISVIVQLASGVLAVVMALIGYSYYALIIRSIISGLLLFIGSYYLNPVKIAFRIKWNAILKIWRFSTYQFLFNFVNYFARNTDKLLIGKFLGSAMLGFYDKAFSLMLMPVQNLTHVITPVLHPVLSDYQDHKDRIYHSFLTLIRILATLGFPLSVVLFFSGKELIFLFYGSQWTQSIPVFQLLSLIIGIEILSSSTGSFFQSANRADLLFVTGIVTSSLIILGVLYGIFIEKSLIGVAHGVIMARCLNFIMETYLLVVRALGFPVSGFIAQLGMPVFISAVVLVANLLLMQLSFGNIYLSLSLKLFISLIAFTSAFLCSRQNRSLVARLAMNIRAKVSGSRHLWVTNLYSKLF